MSGQSSAGRSRLRRRPFLIALGAVAAVAVLAGGTYWWLESRRYESTDDAFIDVREVPVAAEVNGAILAVPVSDNEEVKAGQVLARIDPRDYEAALATARANVSVAQAMIEDYAAQRAAQLAVVDEARKKQAEAQAALSFAADQAKRYRTLAQRGSGSVQQAQQATATLEQSQAAAASAAAAVTTAQKQIAVLDAQRQSAEAQLQRAEAAVSKAEADLSRTTLVAAVPGRVTNLSAAKGIYATVGQNLMVLVPDKVWVTANFKETEVGKMRPGDPVSIAIDAYPGRTFRGHVDSIQAGSGTAFSLLPPENATGNFVKVVQRVPVKIVFDHRPDVLLGPGLSVVPTVKVR